jgi:hypothetical protein
MPTATAFSYDIPASSAFLISTCSDLHCDVLNSRIALVSGRQPSSSGLPTATSWFR